MKTATIPHLIKHLGKIKTEDLDSFIAYIQKVIKDKAIKEGGGSIDNIIDKLIASLVNVPFDRMDEFVQKAFAYVEKFSQEKQKLDDLERFDLILTLSAIPLDNLEIVVQKVDPLITDVLKKYRLYYIDPILRGLSRVPPANLDKVIEKIPLFLEEKITSHEFLVFVSTLGKVNPDHLDKVIEQALKIIRKDMSITDKAYIIAGLGEIAPETLDKVTDNVRSLVKESMNGHDVGFVLIRTIGKIPLANMDKVIEKAKLFIKDDMNAGDRSDIINTLKTVDPNILDKVVENANKIIKKGMDSGQIIQIIRQSTPK